jgi:hypothetical protein
MQQRALAAAGFAVSATLSPAANDKIDAAQHRDLFAGGAVALGQGADSQHD